MPFFFHSSSTTLSALFELFLTLTFAVVINILLRSFIKIPKRLDNKRGRTYVAIIRNVISAIVFTIALYIIFVIFQINIVPLIASAGLIGIILGIGTRPFVEDLISGLFLLTQATISIGDYVTVAGIEGTIEDIGFRTITIRGVDGTVNIISNGQIKQVTNYSRRDAVVFVDFPIKGDEDIDTILEIMRDELFQMIANKKTDYKIAPQSKVWGIQAVQVPNCMLIRVALVTVASLREEVDKVYRYNIVKRFKKQKIQFA